MVSSTHSAVHQLGTPAKRAVLLPDVRIEFPHSLLNPRAWAPAWGCDARNWKIA